MRELSEWHANESIIFLKLQNEEKLAFVFQVDWLKMFFRYKRLVSD